MNELISIILPVYNRENFVEECIRSALNQSYPHLEIIVIDDGSTDRSREICHALAAEDSRIRLLAGDHAGVSAARNKGLEAAKGDFLFFLDSDDAIHPRLLEASVRDMEAAHAAMAAPGVVKVPAAHWHKAVLSIRQDHRPAQSTYASHQEALGTLLTNDDLLRTIQGVMMRRELVGDTRFRTDLSIGEDFFFVYENLIKGADAVFLNRNWYYGRLHDRNSSWDYSYDGFRSRLLRRRLVWERETALGREAFAAIQKRGVFAAYLRCQSHHRVFSPDCRKMRRDLRQHRRLLLPVMSPKEKLKFLLALYLPPLHRLIFRLRKG